MSITDEVACQTWRTCDDVLNYASPGMDMITRLHLAIFSREPKGKIAFSSALFKSMTGRPCDSMPMVGISVFALYALSDDIEYSCWIAMELMLGKTSYTHQRCTGSLLFRTDDFPYSKKIHFLYKNANGEKRNLVAHFYVEGDAFLFIVAFANED